MKTRILVFLLMLTVTMVLCACDAKRRAQRRIRRITERCPELVTVQAHPIDTFIESATNDSLTVTYEAEPEPVHFADTLRYPQIVVEEPPPEKKKPPAFMWFLLGMVVVLLAVIITAITIVIKMVKVS